MPCASLLFSVTKGIVGAVGRFEAAGPGTWIQTDAPNSSRSLALRAKPMPVTSPTPATLRITEGPHNLVVKSANHTDWNRSITILKDGTVIVKATLEPN